MCGITAIFSSDAFSKQGENQSKQTTAANKIAHRGPDDFRTEVVRVERTDCFLAFHRLAIIDPNADGMQPLRVKAYPHIWLMCNGEIYNYQKIQMKYGFELETPSDAEVIIHLYAQGGIEQAASMLDGVFAFCLLDTNARRIFIARDTLGVKPMFTLFNKKDVLAVCSEGKGIIDVWKDGDFAENVIQPFEPGHVQTYEITADGTIVDVSRHKFHRFDSPPHWSNIAGVQLDDADVSANIRNLLSNAVEKRLMSYRKIGCLLSGGLDSSLIAALTVKHAREQHFPEPIRTFAVGMKGSPDLVKAREVATYLGCDHHEIMITAQDITDIVGDAVYHLESYCISVIRHALGMFLLSKHIREHTDIAVVLSGEGADEVAQGYLPFHNAPSVEVADAEARRMLDDMYLFDLVRPERMTAAHGLELRVPFLDHHFMSYYLSLPAHLRRPINGIEKYTLRNAFDSTDLLPRNVLWRRKETFGDGLTASDGVSWVSSLLEVCGKMVSDEEMANASDVFPVNTPQTKEAYHYRKLFNKFYPGHAHWTPYFWTFKWVHGELYKSKHDKGGSLAPARALPIYKVPIAF